VRGAYAEDEEEEGIGALLVEYTHTTPGVPKPQKDRKLDEVTSWRRAGPGTGWRRTDATASCIMP
jgi:hypothetical protein